MLIAALALTWTLTGCIASTGSQAQLSASEGSGDLVVYLVLEEGEMVTSQAWWADQAPEVSVNVQDTASPYEAIILKNDVVVTREPLLGSAERAALTWTSSQAGTVAQTGDTFEVFVVNATTGSTAASFGLEISS